MNHSNSNNTNKSCNNFWKHLNLMIKKAFKLQMRHPIRSLSEMVSKYITNIVYPHIGCGNFYTNLLCS